MKLNDNEVEALLALLEVSVTGDNHGMLTHLGEQD